MLRFTTIWKRVGNMWKTPNCRVLFGNKLQMDLIWHFEDCRVSGWWIWISTFLCSLCKRDLYWQIIRPTSRSRSIDHKVHHLLLLYNGYTTSLSLHFLYTLLRIKAILVLLTIRFCWNSVTSKERIWFMLGIVFHLFTSERKLQVVIRCIIILRCTCTYRYFKPVTNVVYVTL